MIPNSSRVDRFIENIVNGKESLNIKDLDMFFPIEGLNCNCIADYALLNPDMIFKYLKNLK